MQTREITKRTAGDQAVVRDAVSPDTPCTSSATTNPRPILRSSARKTCETFRTKIPVSLAIKLPLISTEEHIPSVDDIDTAGDCSMIAQSQDTPCRAARRYCARKSVSMNDMRRARNKYQQMRENCETTSETNQNHKTTSVCTGKSRESGNSEQIFVDGFPKSAGYKVLSFMVMNAWRRRREDVKKLTADLLNSKSSVLKSKNQVYVLKSFFKLEQGQKEKALVKLQNLLLKYEALALQHHEQKNKNLNILEEIEAHKTNCGQLSSALESTQTELNIALASARVLEQQYEQERRRVTDLLTERTIMVEKMDLAEFKHEEKHSETAERLRKHQQTIFDYKEKVLALGNRLEALNTCEQTVREYEERDRNQLIVIQALSDKFESLQKHYDSFVTVRAMRFINRLPGSSFPYIQMFGHYLTPIIPLPKFSDENLQQPPLT